MADYRRSSRNTSSIDVAGDIGSVLIGYDYQFFPAGGTPQLPDLFSGYLPEMPARGFCSFTANVGTVAQATKDTIQQIYDQAGVYIDFVSGPADLSLSH
jgi:hypothetical protein